MKPKPPKKQVAPPCPAAVWIALAVGLCTLAAGCVHRRFTVRTDPPGARLFVDDYEIGTTPVSHDFTYYGTRKIRLVKDGYETLTVLQPMPAPWWDLPGIDFISENLVPTELRDHRVIDFQLQPQLIVPTEQLMGRADELRRSRNPNVPAGAIAPQGAVPQGTYPENTLPPPSLPQGSVPQGALPPTVPGSTAPGAIPPGIFPPNNVPPSNVAPGAPGAAVPTLPPSGPPAGAAPAVPPAGSSGPPLVPTPPYQPRNFQPPSY